MANRFQAASQASVMSARLLNIELANQWLRRWYQIRSIGLSSELYGGSSNKVTLPSTTSLLMPPIRSRPRRNARSTRWTAAAVSSPGAMTYNSARGEIHAAGSARYAGNTVGEGRVRWERRTVYYQRSERRGKVVSGPSPPLPSLWRFESPFLVRSQQRTVLSAELDRLRKLLRPSVALRGWIDRRRLQAVQLLSVQVSGDVAA